MVTMLLLPEKPNTGAASHKHLRVESRQLLLTALEPYTATALLELAARTEDAIPRKRRTPVSQLPQETKATALDVGGVEPAAAAVRAVSGSLCIFSGIATWTLLVCLVLVKTSSRRGSQLQPFSEEDAGRYRRSCVEFGEEAALPGSLSPDDRALLSSLRLDGSLTFSNTSLAGMDFGRIRFSTPGALVFPKSVRDVEATVRAVRSATASGLTIAARGCGHSVHGQAQVQHGVVLKMSALKGIRVAPDGEPGCPQPFVDAAGGELWIDVLRATLELGFAPRSWTDYLYLSIGGTLSNAGVGGQTFLFGPEISNVLQLDVVTGTGESVKCSPTTNADLFYGVLGGLGQFGIITSARIVLEPAHDKVRWIRAMYTDFATFTRDQELLVSQPRSAAFDYIEGFVVLKNEDPNNGWNSVPFDNQKIDPAMIPADGGTVLYYIELVKKFSAGDAATLDETVERMLAPLRFIPTLLFTTDVPYARFLNRLHQVELGLTSQGLWDVPHPWLNLFVPQSSIAAFDARVFKDMINDDFSGPILIYPLKRDRWDARSSAVIPDESVFYLVAFLRMALPSSGPPLGSLIAENRKILEVCRTAELGCKMYLPEYEDVASWERHFGQQWEAFARRKRTYDPDGILAPGQNIFPRIRRASTDSEALA